MSYTSDGLLIKFTSRILQLEYFADSLGRAHSSLPEARELNVAGLEMLKLLKDAPTSRVIQGLERMKPMLIEGYSNLRQAALVTPQRTPSLEALNREYTSHLVTWNYIYLWWTAQPHVKDVVEEVTNAVYRAWSVFTWDVQSVTLKKLLDEYQTLVISVNGSEKISSAPLNRLRVIADEFLAELTKRAKEPYADLQEDSIIEELESVITSLEVAILTL